MKIPSSKINFSTMPDKVKNFIDTIRERTKNAFSSNIICVKNTHISLNQKLKIEKSSPIEIALPHKIKKFFHMKDKNTLDKTLVNVKNITDANSLFKENILEENASKIITAFMRKHIANQSYDYMFQFGTYWNDMPGKHEEKGIKLMQKLSRENISNLRKELKTLDKQEVEFLDAILQVKLRATHASDATLINKNDTFNIYSRKILTDKNISFPKCHSDNEIDTLANDDFVFFSVDPGEENKKAASRFGSKIYSVDINQPVFEQVACISIYDMLIPRPPDIRKHIQGLSDEAIQTLRKKDQSKYGFTFFGKEMRAGLGLYILKRLRAIPENDRQKILAMRSEDELNHVINGIARPEIKVPKYFFSKEYTSSLFDGTGGFLDPQKVNDKDYMLGKVNKHYKAFANGSDDVKNDYLIALSAVSQEGRSLFYASDNLKENKEIVFTAVKQSGLALKHVGEKFKDDKNLVLTAVQQSGIAIAFASERLKNDRNVLLTAIQNSGLALKYAPDDFKSNKDIVLKAVNNNSFALKYASDRLRDDIDIVLAAIQKNGGALKFASDRLKDNDFIFAMAVKSNKYAIDYASDRIKNNFKRD